MNNPEFYNQSPIPRHSLEEFDKLIYPEDLKKDIPPDLFLSVYAIFLD
jgi:hypothetical protein